MSEAHQREAAIFDAAMELPPEQRAAYLDQACGEDAELRQRVLALLDACGHTSDYLDDSPARGTLTGSVVVEKPGDRIGRYKLLQQIGEGGCGVVYMAEQSEPVRRRVALKIIKLGMDTKSVIARFEAERQALAMMNHPNIAKVFDAGATEAGRPYFVMELVRGVKITDYCDEKKLSTRERLDLFVQVCHAIQHAHQKGIIHRDIKPSNILVSTDDGVAVPKVIDFGVAKATGGQQLTDKTFFTAFEQFIGTPAYMSPEQTLVTNVDIDTRSDIYALGVLLYELLTGQTPLDAKELLAIGLDEMRRTIRETEPERPSTCLSTLPGQELSTTAQRRGLEAPKLVSELRGDLDWIVMKCLEKDRTRRYETANGLAMDIQRHLNNEPVVACPPGNLYRLKKLVQRNKLVFAAGAAVAAALLFGLGISTWMYFQENAARKRAVAAEQAQRKLRQESDARAYASDVRAASDALEDGNLGLSRTLLAAHVPLPGEKDLRGFEWRYLWSLSKGDERTVLRGHSNYVNCVAFSPDGKMLASGSSDHTVKLWQVDTGELVRTGGGHSGAVISLAFSPDGKFLATGGEDNLVLLRNSRTLEIEATLTNLSPRLTFSGHLLIIATGGNLWGEAEGVVKLWDYVAGREVMTLPGTRAAASPDGSLLATANSAGAVKLWALPSGRPLKSFRSPNVVTIAFSADGRAVAWWSMRDGLYLWDLDQEQPTLISPKTPTENGVWSIAFAPDGRTLATGNEYYGISLWDLPNRRELRKLGGHGNAVESVAFSPDGRTIASGSRDDTVMLWNATPPAGAINVITNVVLERWHNIGRPVFSPDGQRMAAALKGGGIRICDVRTCATEAELNGQRLPVAFTPNGEDLLVRDASFSHLQDWNIKTGSLQGTVSLGTNGGYYSDTLSSDNKLIATAYYNGHVLVRSAATGEILRSFSGRVRSVRFSPDARLLACGNWNGTATIWGMKTGEPWTINGFRDAVEAFAFSSDLRWLAVGSWDRTIRLYDLRQRKLLRALTGHKSAVVRLAFSPDCKTLASCGEDDTVRLWNPETGRELLTLESGRPVWFIRFAKNGETLVSGTEGEIRLWRAPSISKIEAEDDGLSRRTPAFGNGR